MTHFKWLKKEIPRWVKEEIITREAGDSLISLYRNEERHSHGEGLFVLAAVCFLTGLIFICAGVWNGLSQDEQFMMALVPLVLSILIIAAILWQDRPVMDRIPTESVRLEEAENTAEPLSGETGETASAVNGIGENRIEESTAAGNKGKDLSSLLPSVPYRHRVPDVIREAAGVFHGVSVLCAVWMVNESFKLSGDWFVLAAVSCVFLLLMSWAFPTAGLGMVYMASSVLVYRLSPYRGWPEAAAWVFLVLALPLLVRLLGERRHKAVVCYSWFGRSAYFSLFTGPRPTFYGRRCFCSCGGAYLDGGQHARFLGRGGGSASPLWRRGRVRRSAGGLLEFRVERRFRKLDLMGFVFRHSCY